MSEDHGSPEFPCAMHQAYAQYRVRILRWDSACFQGTKSLHATPLHVI